MTKKQASYLIGLLVCVVGAIVWFMGGATDMVSTTSEDPNLTYGDFNTIDVVSAPGPDDNDRPELDALARTTLSLSYERVAQEFRVDEYRLYRCPMAEEDDLILTLTAISRLDSGAYTIKAAREALRAWEPNMYEDLGAVLYSDLDRAESVVFPSFVATPGTELRFATTTISGKERGIYYDWYYNIAVIGTSAACVIEGKRRLQGA